MADILVTRKNRRFLLSQKSSISVRLKILEQEIENLKKRVSMLETKQPHSITKQHKKPLGIIKMAKMAGVTKAGAKLCEGIKKKHKLYEYSE